nr:MAG TPA: hypothetical protein [Caudoviricetes sp.]
MFGSDMSCPARSKIFHTHHIAFSTCIIMK